MPRGYRLVILAAFGLALMGAEKSPLAPQGISNTQAATQGNASGKAAKSAPQAVPAPKAPESDPKDTGCPDGKDRRDSDLCAQWKAADSAFDAARAAEWQTFIGWIGLVLGAVTMGAAIAAAIFAKRAAVATEETVKIAGDASQGAVEALSIANRNADAASSSAEASLMSIRPWLEIKLIGVDAFSHNGTRVQSIIRFSLLNHGNSPATQLGNRFILKAVKRYDNGEEITAEAVADADKGDDNRRRYGSVMFPKHGWPQATHGIGVDTEGLPEDEPFFWFGAGVTRYTFANRTAQLKFRFLITGNEDKPITWRQLYEAKPMLSFFKVWMD